MLLAYLWFDRRIVRVWYGALVKGVLLLRHSSRHGDGAAVARGLGGAASLPCRAAGLGKRVSGCWTRSVHVQWCMNIRIWCCLRCGYWSFYQTARNVKSDTNFKFWVIYVTPKGIGFRPRFYCGMLLNSSIVGLIYGCAVFSENCSVYTQSWLDAAFFAVTFWSSAICIPMWGILDI